MNFMELTRPDGEPVFVNFAHVDLEGIKPHKIKLQADRDDGAGKTTPITIEGCEIPLKVKSRASDRNDDSGFSVVVAQSKQEIEDGLKSGTLSLHEGPGADSLRQALDKTDEMKRGINLTQDEGRFTARRPTTEPEHMRLKTPLLKLRGPMG